ncbi:MAG: pilin, partial [Patescibacteria group bacterium]
NKLFLTLALLLLPLFAFAQAPTGGLVPQWCQAGCPCSFCDLYNLADNVIGFLLYSVSVPIAAGAFLYGGVLMLTSGGNPGQITKGRGVMTSAVIGMALAFFAWAIFNTILSTIGFGIKDASWYDIPECESGGGTTCNIDLGPEVVPEQPGAGGTPPPGGPPPEGSLAHEEALAMLNGAGIDVVSTGNCQENREGCTYLGGLSPEIINRIIQVDIGCNGCVIVTGGTEPGHGSHGADHPNTVDIDYNDRVIPSLRGNGISIDANFGKGATCERKLGEETIKVDCDSSPPPNHIHVEL